MGGCNGEDFYIWMDNLLVKIARMYGADKPWARDILIRVLKGEAMNSLLMQEIDDIAKGINVECRKT